MTRNPILVNQDWQEHAGCRNSDVKLFFPVGSTGVAIDEIKAAKAICQCCPVADECLRFAMETNQEAGIWGGTEEDERRRLRRGWAAAGMPARRSATA